AAGLVRKKVDEAFRTLPAELQAGYSSLDVSLFKRSVIINGLHGRGITITRLSAEGIGFWAALHSHRLSLRHLLVEGCSLEPTARDTLPPKIDLPFTTVTIGQVECTNLKATLHDKGLALQGQLTLDSLSGPVDSVRPRAVHLALDRFRYLIPDAGEVIQGRHLELDSRKKLLRLDTLRIVPTLDKEAIGRKRGHQVDVVDATIEGISAEGLGIMGLFHHKMTASEIRTESARIYVFRDRRLPLVRGDKPLPIESLKALPVTLRVDAVDMGPIFFTYEEYPAKGGQTGRLKIFRLKAHIAPLINRPEKGDPEYIKVRTEGSLMNSGSVSATTWMPLHKGDPYRVEGAFHELDVTSLNDPAEHLGKLHLESGMLNFLAFKFEMSPEKSTGQIIGEYHNLVVDKLKDNGKRAGFKSWALKKFIIPRDKDKSLPVKKRTGKVDYKRDPQRYFSYYLLHSLLVGVKSSFSLGFLLPG
ncbi:MAG TPA: hypothetical protein VG605_01580, partial [Puia sp.]|nr:hypothetical protein [Puia sp.]